MKKIIQILYYWLKKNWFILVLLLITIGIIYLINIPEGKLPDLYTNYVDSVISVFSVLLVIALTFAFIKKEWEESLDKELIVHFLTPNNEYAYSCYGANLLPNADIRSLSQQIGAQMAKTRQLDFNPSIQMVSNGTLRVKKNNIEHRWIKYYEIVFNLLSDQSDGSYTVWNINHNEIKKLKLKKRDKVFTYQYSHITKEKMLSYDQLNFENFNKIESTFYEKQNHMVYLTNSAILTNTGSFDFDIISLEKAKEFINNNKFVSAIGHQSTANLLTKLLNSKIEYNRVSIDLKKGDTCLVFRLKDRLVEGKIYTEEQINDIGFEFGLLKKTDD